MKTKPTRASVAAYIAAIADDARRTDCRALVKLMRQVTGAKPQMWGPGMVGFGSYRYRYASGHEGEWFVTGFSSRKTDLTVYVMAGFDGYPDLMARLGKYRTGKSCLYLRQLSDVHAGVLATLLRRSAAYIRRKYG